MPRPVIARRTPAATRLLALSGLALILLLPWLAQFGGLHWVRVLAMCQIYILLAVGLNLIVGQAGLLDLGYIGFYAVGAYLYAWLNSPHLAEHFAFWQSLGARRGGWCCPPPCWPPPWRGSCWARPRSSCGATTWPS